MPRTFALAVLGLLLGALLGVTLFDHGPGIEPLALATAAAGAATGLLASAATTRRRRDS